MGEVLANARHSGRRVSGDPESRYKSERFWIPGSALRAAPE
jgi:hypothetical protein